MQMVTIPLPPCDTKRVKAQLYDEFGVEAPLVEWQGKPFIRVSIQAYNTQEDVERLLAALPRVLDA
jgi:isopenicillin-N epimerase